GIPLYRADCVAFESTVVVADADPVARNDDFSGPRGTDRLEPEGGDRRALAPDDRRGSLPDRRREAHDSPSGKVSRPEHRVPGESRRVRGAGAARVATNAMANNPHCGLRPHVELSVCKSIQAGRTSGRRTARIR